MAGFDPTFLISLCCSLTCCVLFLVAIIGGIMFVLRRGKKEPEVEEAPKAKAGANKAEAAPKKLDERPVPAPTVAPMPPPAPVDDDDSPTVVAPPPPGMAEPPPPPPAAGEPEKKKKSKAGQTIIAFDDEDDEDF